MPNLPPWVDKYIGIPFVEKGRSRAGIDCWGLNWLVQREAFYREVPAYDEQYMTTQDIAALERLINDEMPAARPVAPHAGATALFRVDGALAHVGVVVTGPQHSNYDPGVFLHAEAGKDSCVESYLSLKWSRRLFGFYEYVAG